MVALSAVDTAVFTLRPNYRDPVSMVITTTFSFELRKFLPPRSNGIYGGPQVLRHIENSDLGCGGGGGRDNADVFRLAGLTFMTNANADPSSTSTFVTQSARIQAHLIV